MAVCLIVGCSYLNENKLNFKMRTIEVILGIFAAVAFALAGWLISDGKKTESLYALYVGLFISIVLIILALVNYLANREREESPLQNISVSEIGNKNIASNSQFNNKAVQRNKPLESEINETEKEILVYLFNSNVDRTINGIIQNLRFSYVEQANYHLENLARRGYIKTPEKFPIVWRELPEYQLKQKGRE